MKSSDSVISKFLVSLEAWNDEELRRLDQLLADQHAVRRLRNILLETIELRSTERLLTDLPARSSRADIAQIASAISPQQKMLVTKILSDRNALPSTRDVIKLVNSALGSNWQYEEFRRGGREKVVQRTWRELVGRNEEERTRAIQRLMAGKERLRDGYRELFRKLVRK